MKITIRECKSGGRIWEHTTDTNDADLAIRAALDKHFGKRHGFYVDRGLTAHPDTTQYGQIGHALRGSPSQSTMTTGRVRIDIDD